MSSILWGEGMSRRALYRNELCLRLLLCVVVWSVGHSLFYGDLKYYANIAEVFRFDNLPYRDYVWEYPPISVLVPALGLLTAHNQALFYVVFLLAMIAVEYGSLCLMRLRGNPEKFDEITKYWTLAVLPLMTFGYFRFDLLTMGCAVFAILAMTSGRRYVLAVFIGFGIKLWPIVFIAAMFLQRRFRDMLVCLTSCLALVGVWYLFSAHGFDRFIEWRQAEGFQVESIPGSLLLLAGREWKFSFGAVVVSDQGFAWVKQVMTVLMVAIPAIALAFAVKRRGQVNLVAFVGLLVLVLMLCQRLLSPQFLIWLAPFVVWLWPTFRRQGFIFGAAVWITVIVIQIYAQYVEGNPAVVMLEIIRNGLLLWLAVEMWRITFSRPAPRESLE